MIIRNRNLDPLRQVRVYRICHRSARFMVSGVRFQVSVKTDSGTLSTDYITPRSSPVKESAGHEQLCHSRLQLVADT
jgi:hypothetical protein